MKPREMGSMWLRDRAEHLRTSANSAERAYSATGDMGRMCARVARAYRKAATLLDDEATKLENEAMSAAGTEETDG